MSCYLPSCRFSREERVCPYHPALTEAQEPKVLGMLDLQDWQPMESAPKDGTNILAWRAGWDMPAFVNWRVNHRVSRAFWNDAFEHDAYELETEPPTHWLPLPPFPRVMGPHP